MSRPCGASRSTPKDLLARLLSCQFIFAGPLLAGPGPPGRFYRFARGSRAILTRCPSSDWSQEFARQTSARPQEGALSYSLHSRLLATYRFDSRSSYVMPRRQSPATAGLPPPTPSSRPRVSRNNTTPHPAPALCSTRAGARQRRSVRHSRVRERLAERHGLRQLKKLAWIQMTPSNPYHSQNTIAVCPLFTEFHIQTVCALARGVARTWHMQL